MSTSVTCDACGRPVKDVAYSVSAVPVDDVARVMHRRYYHYGCVATYGNGSEPPTAYVLRDPRGYWADDDGERFTAVMADAHRFDAHRAVELLGVGAPVAGLVATPVKGG
jgi:hypothetical protein